MTTRAAKRAALVLAASTLAACGGAQTQQNSQTAEAPRPVERPREANNANQCGGNGGMTIEGQLGHLSESQLLSVLRPATSQLAGCYNDRLGEHPYLAGDISLKIRIGADGAPRWVIPLSSTIGDRATEQCMIERAMALRFPTPCGGETETTYPLGFEAGEDARPATAWPPSRIDRAVDSHRSALARCTQGHPGPYTVTLYAAPRGTVASVGVGVPSEEAASAIDCLVREVSSWRLPDPGSYYAKATFQLD